MSLSHTSRRSRLYREFRLFRHFRPETRDQPAAKSALQHHNSYDAIEFISRSESILSMDITVDCWQGAMIGCQLWSVVKLPKPGDLGI